MDYARNNLDKSSSPYLLQHADNPVWWQEWSSEAINYARQEDKPILVSVGYSTCHWCHLMAAEAFSDVTTADFLNSHFISIKIDREQRPDIDQFLMDFMNHQSGSGGWPLNVFLTTDLRPVYALTYAPVESRDSALSFLSISIKVHDYIQGSGQEIPLFSHKAYNPSYSAEPDLIDTFSEYFDDKNGGFGRGQKFPSHSALLYLLYSQSIEENKVVSEICTKTLNAMMLRGLNDHLQGGIFRYCIDPGWTIPHFEKMLYDQAMVLWVYSLAYKVLGDSGYRLMALKILKCLEESFERDGFYITAHNADTGHKEGATYLWSYNELEEILSPEEFSIFKQTYNIGRTGNFEGRNHLIKLNNNYLKEIEDKLLYLRKSREQPSRDEKIICGINALTAISFIQAGRYLDRSDLIEKAGLLIKNLIQGFWNGKTLGHSLFNGITQEQSFLSDAAAMLTAISMLYEHDHSWEKMMTAMASFVNTFREGNEWFESKSDDFPPVNASLFDHPVPSGLSLAWMGMTRAVILSGGTPSELKFRQSLQADFYNIAGMVSNGLFHIFTSKKIIPWKLIPANSLQMLGEPEIDCFMGVCRPVS
jgi:uncharacterized protein YyaL (SSP411 family)